MNNYLKINMINKLYKGNLVAVLVSPGYGAGWSTWGNSESAFDGELAQAVLDDKPHSELVAIAKKNWPDQYDGGVSQLTVVWVEQGTKFVIDEYDGYESIKFENDFDWITA